MIADDHCLFLSHFFITIFYVTLLQTFAHVQRSNSNDMCIGAFHRSRTPYTSTQRTHTTIRGIANAIYCNRNIDRETETKRERKRMRENIAKSINNIINKNWNEFFNFCVCFIVLCRMVAHHKFYFKSLSIMFICLYHLLFKRCWVLCLLCCAASKCVCVWEWCIIYKRFVERCARIRPQE